MAVAQTIFTGKPTDKLVKQDVYTSFTNTLPKNLTGKTFDEFKNITTQLTDILTGKDTSLKDIVKSAKSAIKSTRSVLSTYNNVKDALGSGTFSALDKIAGGALDNIINPEYIPKGLIGQTSATVRDVTRIIKGGQLDDILVVSELANRLVESDLVKIVDNQVTGGALAELVKGSASTGLVEVIDAVNDAPALQDKLELVYKATLEDVAETGDIDSVGKMAEKIGQDVYAGAENVVNKVLNAFSDNTTKPSQNAQKAASIKENLNKVSSTWDKTYINGTAVNNNKAYTNMSSDARRILLSDSTPSTQTMVAMSEVTYDDKLVNQDLVKASRWIYDSANGPRRYIVQ